MQELHRSAYEFIEFYPEQSLVKYVVTRESRDMVWPDMQHALLQFARILRQTKPENVLVDAVHFEHLLFKDMQKWINDNLIIAMNEVKLKKWAIIVPHQFLTQVSIEQTMAANPSNTFEAQYFEEEEEARLWLDLPLQHHEVG
ncbi:MAG TPA: hypothetical protein VD996_09645 [Chitinophagaceae bacterium]|nr:hypothetical protein [Chitinophagaceae bacterium]